MRRRVEHMNQVGRAVNCNLETKLPNLRRVDVAASSPENDALIAFYVGAAKSKATQRAYASDLREFLATGGRIPASSDEIVRYLAVSSDLALSTLKRRLAALADAHATAGHPDPTKAPLVRTVLRGIARVHGAHVLSPLPLQSLDLVRTITAIPTDLAGFRDKAVLLVGFASALRRSELVGLDVDAINLTFNPARISIRQSKTDPFGQGQLVPLPRLNGSLCPVEALCAWMSAAKIERGPVFRSITRWGGVGDAALSAASVTLIVRKRALRAGVPLERLSAHSLRSGFAVSAVAAGMALPLIQGVTRHKTLGGVAAYVKMAGPPNATSMRALIYGEPRVEQT